jgi:MraZ protein
MEFFDQFEHTIDDKGRMVLPAAFRSAFADGGFVTFMGRSVGLFTAEGFDKHRRKLSMSDVFSRRDLSQLMALTTPFVPDSQHRISIGAKLRGRVGLDREVTVVGQGSHAAVFPRSVWEAQEAESSVADGSGLALPDKFDALEFL